MHRSASRLSRTRTWCAGLQTETRKLRHFLSLAHAAYLDSDEELFAKTTVMPGDLLTSAWEVVDLVPAHYVAVCHHSKTIVVSVRGTWGTWCECARARLSAASCSLSGAQFHCVVA